MKVRIVKYADGYYPQYKTFFRWRTYVRPGYNYRKHRCATKEEAEEFLLSQKQEVVAKFEI